jgi:hypothetical protein
VSRGITQRNDLGMRRWVATADRAIRSATDHAIALDHERTHGHLACQRCRARKLESLAHEFAVGDQRSTLEIACRCSVFMVDIMVIIILTRPHSPIDRRRLSTASVLSIGLILSSVPSFAPRR